MSSLGNVSGLGSSYTVHPGSGRATTPRKRPDCARAKPSADDLALNSARLGSDARAAESSVMESARGRLSDSRDAEVPASSCDVFRPNQKCKSYENDFASGVFLKV